MRLWHEKLIKRLDNNRLLGQHRECAALRGNGWGKKHSVVDYVFKYSPSRLFHYHWEIMMEMKNRGYKIDEQWMDCCYRGKNCMPWDENIRIETTKDTVRLEKEEFIYDEHNRNYLNECLENLRSKGVEIKV